MATTCWSSGGKRTWSSCGEPERPARGRSTRPDSRLILLSRTPRLGPWQSHGRAGRLAANAGIALAKLLAFAFTGASSMLAEAVHSLADTGNQALLLGAIAILLGCKVEFDTRLTFEQLTNAIDAAESRVRAAVPAVGLIYMEPDLCEPADGARPA